MAVSFFICYILIWLWYNKSDVVVSDIFQISSQPDDVFSDNSRHDIFSSFIQNEIFPVVVAYLEVLFIIIQSYP